MFKAPFILVTLIIFACHVRVDASPCPIPNHPGTVHSGQIIAALNSGSIPIFEGTDTQCYNYSLPYDFRTTPEIAIAVHDFESEPSNNVFFFIKAIHSQSLSMVPFVIRTQWSYTRWTQISFSFIAEDRTDLQSGYYQIDSGSLSGCQNGKQIQILMPFRKQFNSYLINYSLFLHGFQISTVQQSQQSRSPFQIQIVKSSVNITGITFGVTVTTNTQVDSVYVSYIAYQSTSLNLIVGSYIFDRAVSSSLVYTSKESIPRSYARIYGLTGFIINYSSNLLLLQTKWDGFSFIFDLGRSTTLTQYLSFSYIFFIGSECVDCLGYQISYNSTCVNFCPQGTYKTLEDFCLSCGIGKVWNGYQCVPECPKGQFLNTLTNLCECPPSLNWNGQSCIPCTAGKVFIKETLSCQCPRPLKWNGYACAQIEDCKDGKLWNVYTYSCKCDDTAYWNGTFCVTIIPCKGGQVHNMNYQCICPSNYYWNGQNCTFSPCIGGQIWQGTKCVCSAGLNFNGKMCIQCINGQVWDQTTSICKCQDGYKWNGQYCERTYNCTGNRIWNVTYEQCICQQRYYWSGYACLPIPSCNGGQYWNAVLMNCICSSFQKWDGGRCVSCINGQIWDPTTLKCVCPPGTITLNNVCQIQQQCTGGKMFMQNTLKCQCPESTVWNGDSCISNPCSNGREWSTTYQSCVCPGNKVWANDRCIPPQIACTYGKVWNPKIYACECPMGTYPSINKCDPVPVCRNGMTYNPLTNQCTCPFGLILKNYQCVDPQCQVGQYWNGYNCTVISCPAPSYFYQNRCIYGGPNQCTYGYFWNGQNCVLYPPTCPLGTQWQQSSCQSNGACSNGYYLNKGGSCESFPQQCTPPSVWTSNSCGISGNGCPNGTFSSNNKCQPYVACKNGHVWDSIYLRCICPAGLISNGEACIECSSGKTWVTGVGCICPDGAFDTGSSCETATTSKCQSIPNAVTENGKCKCRPAFTKIGFQCVCYGTQIGDLCDKCSYKPNSDWVIASNICQCKSGYTQIRGNCVQNGLSQGTDSSSQCNVGTYFDQNNKMCLACPDGCLSCFDCYRCKLCRPQFIYNPSTQQCVEKCGDGYKFVLECDDNNNIDGDGCSRDCKIEPGYACSGGSPDNKDSCYVFRPERITLTQTGQIRKSTSIVLNVKLNYLPNSLLFSGDCANNCNQILQASLIDGDKSAVSITSAFIIGSRYSFTVTIDFGRSYIGAFKLSVGVSQGLVSKYFGALPTDTLVVDVKPQYLAAISDSNSDNLF